MNTITLYKITGYSLFPHSGDANLKPLEAVEYDLPASYYIAPTHLGSKAIFKWDQVYACNILVDPETGEPVLQSHKERHILKRSTTMKDPL